MVEKIYLIAPQKIGKINPDIYGVFAEHIGGVIYDGIYCGDKAENVRGFRKEIIEKSLENFGYILIAEDMDEAIEAGARFIVSPGFDPEIVDYCIEKQIPVFPGCVTASELAQAVKRGLEVVKFFPAETSGGLAAIKALAAPYVGMKFMPTGGINPGNVRTYLESDVILACGGSWMVKKDLIQSGQFDEIRQMTADAVALVREVRGSQEK